MLSRSLCALVFAGIACAISPFAMAQKCSVAPSAADGADAHRWLSPIQDAANRQNFQGTLIVSAGGMVASSRIAHYCDGADQYERIEALDGQMRRVFRHNDVVQTRWPTKHVVLVEQRDLLSTFPALLQVGDYHLDDFYEVKTSGVERVAGYDANVLVVTPKDDHRFGYRLWSERSSGLLLRAEVVGQKGEILESAAFSDVMINVKPQPDSVLGPMRKLGSDRVLRPVLTRTKMETEGWSLKPVAPGFKLLSCVKRALDGAAEGPAAQTPHVVQSIFSDGLTHVSIFIEAFDPARHTQPMQTSIGATQTLMRRQGDWWITVLGDVPAETLRQFASAMERTP
jgi:sigma-E factor negative regulatory protein RseB